MNNENTTDAVEPGMEILLPFAHITTAAAMLSEQIGAFLDASTGGTLSADSQLEQMEAIYRSYGDPHGVTSEGFSQWWRDVSEGIGAMLFSCQALQAALVGAPMLDTTLPDSPAVEAAAEIAADAQQADTQVRARLHYRAWHLEAGDLVARMERRGL